MTAVGCWFIETIEPNPKSHYFPEERQYKIRDCHGRCEESCSKRTCEYIYYGTQLIKIPPLQQLAEALESME